MANFIANIVISVVFLIELFISFATAGYLLRPLIWNITGFTYTGYTDVSIILSSPIILFNSVIFDLILRNVRKISIINYMINALSGLFKFIYCIFAVGEIIILLNTGILMVIFCPIHMHPYPWVGFGVHLMMVSRHVSFTFIDR